MQLKKITSFFSFIFIFFALSFSHAENFIEREDVKTYLNELSASYGLSKRELEAILSDHQPNKRIIDMISGPSEKRLQWYEY